MTIAEALSHALATLRFQLGAASASPGDERTDPEGADCDGHLHTERPFDEQEGSYRVLMTHWF